MLATNVTWVAKPPGLYATGWRGQTNFASVTDGLSNTLFVGEKHVRRGQFGIGWTYGSTAAGDSSIWNDDYEIPTHRAAGPGYGLARTPDEPFNYQFGSWHSGGQCQFVMGDGSVRALSPTISTTTLGLLAARDDGQPVPSLD
jgi:prepilin-type processing-associated H-X9-DG protein